MMMNTEIRKKMDRNWKGENQYRNKKEKKGNDTNKKIGKKWIQN